MAMMKNDVNALMLVTIIVVSAIFLLVTVIGVDGWYKMEEKEEVAAKWDESPNTWLLNLRAEEAANLRAGRRINARHYHVPITEAMRIFVKQHSAPQTQPAE